MKTTIAGRLLLALVGSATLTTCIFSYTGFKLFPKQEPDRTGNELCVEVRYELNESVKYGLITQEDADAVSARCFRIYGDDQ